MKSLKILNFLIAHFRYFIDNHIVYWMIFNIWQFELNTSIAWLCFKVFSKNIAFVTSKQKNEAWCQNIKFFKILCKLLKKVFKIFGKICCDKWPLSKVFFIFYKTS